MKFFVGLHHPADARRFARSFISVNQLRSRRSTFPANDWILDCGAFTEVDRRGPLAWSGGAVARYADEIGRWARLASGNLLAAVAPDLMCEPEMIRKVGIGQQSARVHAGITIHQYLLVMEHFGWSPPCYVMPVLQGYTPSDYVWCIGQYGTSLKSGMWVGVGSVCKRNANPAAIEAVLLAIHEVRPDLKLHGFGVKLTALSSAVVRDHLYSSDSMAWSYHARKNGRSGNDPREAERYVRRVESQSVQCALEI
jgi:hypothetical protein